MITFKFSIDNSIVILSFDDNSIKNLENIGINVHEELKSSFAIEFDTNIEVIRDEQYNHISDSRS